MSSYVPAEFRRLVAQRAGGVCEYCLIHEDDTYLGCQVEHVVSEKHGGLTVSDNLAYACVFCNRFKGTDLGSLAPQSGQLVRFFHPRTDKWSAHFSLVGPRIVPLSDIGSVTIRILEMNRPERILEREELIKVGRYPSAAALNLISADSPRR